MVSHLKLNAQEQKSVNYVYTMTFNQLIMLRALEECAFLITIWVSFFFQQRLKIVVDNNLQIYIIILLEIKHLFLP